MSCSMSYCSAQTMTKKLKWACGSPEQGTSTATVPKEDTHLRETPISKGLAVATLMDRMISSE